MKNNIHLGKYDLNKLLRNPGLIHRIQDNLVALKGDSLLATCVRDGAPTRPEEAIKTIIESYRDNPELTTRLIGKETIQLIAEFEGKEDADDLKHVNI